MLFNYALNVGTAICNSVSTLYSKKSHSFDVTIRSKNTGHFWSLHNPDCQENDVVIIFHSHHAEPYHMHGRNWMLRQAVRGIKRHDCWQMNDRN